MKINSLLLTVCLAATAGLMTTGCRSGARTPVNATKYDVENHEPVVLLGSRVQRSVTCSGLHKRTTSDGRLEIVANVRNREARRLEVQLNCEFKDGAGRVVDAGPFRSLVLSPLAQEAVVFTAMNDSAKNFTIRVREVQ
jgi:uncharacterized protein YcfL